MIIFTNNILKIDINSQCHRSVCWAAVNGLEDTYCLVL